MMNKFSTQSIETHVKDYYRLVDQGEYQKLYELFSQDIVYQRCEHKIVGMQNFKAFYEQDRQIVGAHTIHHLITSDNRIAVQGVFNGRNASDAVVVLDFADFFTFNTAEKITHRFTYLAHGYQSTT